MDCYGQLAVGRVIPDHSTQLYHNPYQIAQELSQKTSKEARDWRGEALDGIPRPGTKGHFFDLSEPIAGAGSLFKLQILGFSIHLLLQTLDFGS